MKITLLIELILFTILMFSCIKYNDVNYYKGAIVLKKDVAKDGPNSYIKMYIQMPNGNYETLNLKSGMAEMFAVGDTIGGTASYKAYSDTTESPMIEYKIDEIKESKKVDEY